MDVAPGLSPLLDTARLLAAVPESGQLAQPLPIVREDEAGDLVASFNRLLVTSKARQDALRRSETRFRTMMEDIPGVAVQGYAMDGTVTFWNHAAESLYGYSAQEALGAKLLDLIIPESLHQGVRETMAQMAATGVAIPADELLLKTKRGTLVPVFSSHAVVKPVTGPMELFCLDIDLTERKRMEEQVRKMAFYDPLTGLPNPMTAWPTPLRQTSATVFMVH